jgi:hypothetical protein
MPSWFSPLWQKFLMDEEQPAHFGKGKENKSSATPAKGCASSTPYTHKALEKLYQTVSIDSSSTPQTPDDKKRQLLLLKHKARVRWCNLMTRCSGIRH